MDGGSYRIATVSGTSITLNGLQPGTEYQIVVRAIIGGMYVPNSSWFYVTTLDASEEEPPVDDEPTIEEPIDKPSVEKPPIDESTDEPSVDIPLVEEPIEEEPVIDIPIAPSAPTDMRIEESSPYSIVLQWTQSDEVSSYILEYRRTSDTEGEWIQVTAPVADATSVRIEGLKPVTQYTFRLTAVNEAGTATTEMTAATTANPDALLPVKPRVRLDKKATTTTSLTIKLLAPNSRTSLDANAHYTISWNPTARNSTAPSGHVEGVTGTQFTLTDLNPGTRYRITVTPYNENGQSHDSRNRSMHTTVNATTQRYDTLRVQKLRLSMAEIFYHALHN